MKPPRILVVAEHDLGQLKLATLSAVACARRIPLATGEFDILVAGESIGGVEAYPRLWCGGSVGGRSCGTAASAGRQVRTSHCFARQGTPHHAGGGDFVDIQQRHSPGAAALLDAGMLTDVTSIIPDGDDYTFERVMFAGNVIGTVKLDGPVKVFTVRAAAFTAPEKQETNSPIVAIKVDVESLPNQMVSRDEKPSGRPDASKARIVVSGGRALKNAEDFERIVGGLADALGARSVRRERWSTQGSRPIHCRSARPAKSWLRSCTSPWGFPGRFSISPG